MMLHHTDSLFFYIEEAELGLVRCLFLLVNLFNNLSHISQYFILNLVML